MILQVGVNTFLYLSLSVDILSSDFKYLQRLALTKSMYSIDLFRWAKPVGHLHKL